MLYKVDTEAEFKFDIVKDELAIRPRTLRVRRYKSRIPTSDKHYLTASWGEDIDLNKSSFGFPGTIYHKTRPRPSSEERESVLSLLDALAEKFCKYSELVGLSTDEMRQRLFWGLLLQENPPGLQEVPDGIFR